MRETRYDINITLRDNRSMKPYENARYVDEGWCVRIETEEKTIRINKNSIVCMTLREVSE